MSDIVDRLRAPAYWISGSSEGHEGDNNAPLEAASYIEIVVDDLNKFRNGEYFLTLNDHIRQQETEIRSMQDTIERLRAALKIIAWEGYEDHDFQRIARAALGEEKKG